MARFGIGVAALLAVHALALHGQLIEVDLQKSAGDIRPLHGVNGGPLCYRGTVDLSAYHRALRIPVTRLHDVPWVNAEAVDIHILFPDFRADPEQAENYRFAATDDYIAAITNVQSQIVFRLGESIEHTPRQYFVHPPADPGKWAAVCLGIVRHYNHGWAGGFRHGIRYWEIWNEPDVRPNMWTGSDEQFFELYATAAKAIKSSFPEVSVGGPGVGGTGEFKGETFTPAPFAEKFLVYCREHHAPLDFFSWHRYTSKPWDLPRRARAMRRLLDEHSFTRTESHLNEWNYLPNDDWGPLTRTGQGQAREDWYQQMSGPAGAAFAACGLMLLQNARVDVANFYTGEVQGFGLFNFQGLPKRSFYAFKAFRELLNTPVRIEARGEIDGRMAVLAGTDASRQQACILVSKISASQPKTGARDAARPAEALTVRLFNRAWTGPTRFEVRVVDERHELELVRQGVLESTENDLTFNLAEPSVALINVRPE
jgi:hypothetical protein